MFKRILVPIDGSPRAEHAARAAIDLAKFHSAAIVALYVYPTFHLMVAEPFVASPELFSLDAYVAAQQKVAAQYLSVVEQAAGDAGVNCTALSLSGDSAATAIVATASAEDVPCDLIFIGAHGRGLFSQMILGSVTTKVQAMCAIPVLVYRDSKMTAKAE